MKQKVKDIIKNLKEFQIPVIPNESVLSDAERANLYFYLTSQELENYNQQIEEKQPEEIKLKKVKIMQVYDDTNDAVWNFNSFQFKQEERNIKENENQSLNTFKDSNIKFNSLQEIKQYLKQLFQNRQNIIQVDEVNQVDKQLIIQSLNIQIQEPSCDILQLTDVFLSILFKEVEFNCMKRYNYYLDSFCILIKSRIQMFMTNWSFFNITEKLINSIPQYSLSLIDLIKEFTDQALLKQNEKMYAIFFTQLRDIILKFIYEQNQLLCESFRLFLRINHQTVLDFIKQTQKIIFTRNEIKEIIFDETTNKINQLSFLPDCQYQLTFIFYVGLTQRNHSHHCKILAKLLQDCQQNYIQHLDAICQNMLKIKNNANVKQVIEFIGLSVTNPDMLHQKFLDLFVNYAIESNKVDEFTLEMYKTYMYRYLNQQIEGDVMIVNKIISQTFDQMRIPFIIKLLEKLQLDKLSQMLLKRSQFDLNQYILKDESKQIAIFLFKLFLKKDDSFLKNNKFELLKYFLEQISEYEHTKVVLNFLFDEQNRSQNGLIASVIMNCLKKKKPNMNDEIKILLSKNSYYEDEQIIKSLELYRSIFPIEYNFLLDDQTKARIRDKRLL